MATKTTITQAAAVRLMLKFSFWSELYYTMTVFEDDTIPTLATDGRNLWVNAEYWKSLSLDLKISAIAHEIGHKMLLHSTRRGAREPSLWNAAADYVVNGILAANGFQLGKGWLHDTKYTGWSTEAVYSELEKSLPPPQPQPQQGGSNGEGSSKGQSQGKGGDATGGGEDDPADNGGAQGQSGDQAGEGSAGGGEAGEEVPHNLPRGGRGMAAASLPDVTQEWLDKWQDIAELTGSKEAIEQTERDTIEQVQKAVATAKAHGNGVVGIEAFDTVCEPSKEPWYNHLHRYMQSLRSSEYSWARVNKRTLVQHGVFAPHHYSEALGEIVVAIDCSGSVFGEAEQANFAGHVNAILSEARPSKVHVMYFDSRITRHDELDYGCLDFDSRPVGGGGTSFVPIFSKVEHEGIVPEMVIVLTDCYGDYPRDTPPYPVVWASVEKDVGSYYPPFGEFIHVE